MPLCTWALHGVGTRSFGVSRRPLAGLAHGGRMSQFTDDLYRRWLGANGSGTPSRAAAGARAWGYGAQPHGRAVPRDVPHAQGTEPPARPQPASAQSSHPPPLPGLNTPTAPRREAMTRPTTAGIHALKNRVFIMWITERKIIIPWVEDNDLYIVSSKTSRQATPP